MRISALCTAVVTCVVIGHPPPAVAQVDQQRAQEYFKEAQALCERDGGRLWGVSICAPMVIGDARTRTFATSQPPPDAPRPQLIGLVNGPIQWGDTMWAALTWDTIANWPARTRGEAFVHESFHIVQPKLVVSGPAGANEHLDTVDGRYWLRLEWRALARALRESGELRAQAVRDALAFRQARHTRYPDKVESERALYITEGFASYTQTVLAAPSQADAIARGLELLAAAEDGESFVRTFTYTSGPAYGLLLDASSPGWTRTARGSDDPPAMLIRALGVNRSPTPRPLPRDIADVVGSGRTLDSMTSWLSANRFVTRRPCSSKAKTPPHKTQTPATSWRRGFRAWCSASSI